jgi:hypothetical protein
MDDSKALVTQAKAAVVNRDPQDLIRIWAALSEALALLDSEGGVEDREVDAAISAAFWDVTSGITSVAWLDQCWLIYRLRQKIRGPVIMDDGHVVITDVERWQIWESEAAKKDAVNPDYDWTNFCTSRLGIAASTASARKRVWEVFAITLGKSREEMLLAGRAKLMRAAAQTDKDWKRGHRDARLDAYLFGEPHHCLACSEHVSYDDSPPESCPHCQEKYSELPPGTYRETEAWLDVRSKADKADRSDVTVFDFSVSGDDSNFEITCWVRRPGNETAVPIVCAALRRYSMPDLDDEEAEEAWLRLVGAIGEPK